MMPTPLVYLLLSACLVLSVDCASPDPPVPSQLAGKADTNTADGPDEDTLRACSKTEPCGPDEYCRVAEDRCILFSQVPMTGTCVPRPSCEGSSDIYCACVDLMLAWDAPPAQDPPHVRNGVSPLLVDAWARKVAVDLSSVVEFQSTAHGGMALMATARAAFEEHANVAFPLPSATRQQAVSGQLRLRAVDVAGNDLLADRSAPFAVNEVAVAFVPSTTAEKRMLLVRWNLAHLPAYVFFRWSLDVDLQDPPLDLSQPVPLFELEAAPEAAKAWLAPAPMIQIAEPEIQELAMLAAAGAQDVQQLVHRTLQTMASIRRQFPSYPINFQNDALSFARTGLGDCTANANLFAALMRANRVPCRIVNVLQRGPSGQNMHYINEVHLPGTGWVLVEPQSQQIPWNHSWQVQMGVIAPPLEQRGNGFSERANGQTLVYQGVQQLTMIGQEVDQAMQPVDAAQRNLQIVPGLVVANDLQPWFRIHGAN